MQINFRNVTVFGVLAAAAVSTWFLSRPREPAAPAAAAGGDTPLGYYLRDAVVHGTDENGRTYYWIYAAEARQDPEDEGMAFSDVRIDFRDDDAVGWEILAERAVAPGRTDYIDLTNVRLENDASADSEHTVIETPQLRFEPAEHYATTDAPVRVRVGGAEIAGVGLEARLRADMIELKSDVRGQFTR